MNTKTKIAIFSFLLILLLACLSFFIFFFNKSKEPSQEHLYSDGLPRLREEIEPILTNYMITVKYVDESGNEKAITEVRCDQGYGFIMSEGISYLEYGSGQVYTLNPSAKTGWAVSVKNEDAYRTFGASISSFIFIYDIYQNSNPEKIKNSELLGRDVTEYMCKLENSEVRFWIDYEYGITMKFSQTSEESNSAWEVIEFKTNNVTLSDVVNLEEYTIPNITQ